MRLQGATASRCSRLEVHDPERVKKIAALTVEWMKSLDNTAHPMAGYVPVLLAAREWEIDIICRGAPHLLFATVPDGNPIAPTGATIAHPC